MKKLVMKRSSQDISYTHLKVKKTRRKSEKSNDDCHQHSNHELFQLEENPILPIWSHKKQILIQPNESLLNLEECFPISKEKKFRQKISSDMKRRMSKNISLKQSQILKGKILIQEIKNMIEKKTEQNKSEHLISEQKSNKTLKRSSTSLFPKVKVIMKSRTFNSQKLPSFRHPFRILSNDLFEKEDEEDSEDINSTPKYIIYHNQLFRKTWDFFLIIFALYSGLAIPVLLATYSTSLLINQFEIFLEFFFIIDLILNFLTTFKDKEENLKTNPKDILMNYLMNGFIIDICGSFPNKGISFIINGELGFIGQFINWLKILRLFRIKRVKINLPYFSRIHIFNRVFRFMFIFVVLIHITSCFFIYIGESTRHSTSWTTSLKESYSFFSLYIASIYFNLVTIYTVGYGDITPVSTDEKLFLILFLFFGNLLYSYGISSLSTFFP